MATGSAPPSLGPLRFRPVLKDYLWGGRNLGRLVGRDLPAGTIAESWEISDHPNGETPVASGPVEGATLGRLLDSHGVRLIGERNREALVRKRFPLLIKLLDANQWLSVQVHPGDDYARERESDLGKTEMWIVLHARPGAEIILGLERPATADGLRAALAAKQLGDWLHRVPARPGDVFFVPPGTIHAIGPGLVLAEIQQSSDVTYRLYDWDRIDADGASRTLHLDRALAVADLGAVRLGAVEPRRLDSDAGEHELLVECPHFRTERLRLAESTFRAECDGSTFEIWALLSGSAAIEWRGGAAEFSPVSWTLLPADLGGFAVHAQGRAELLRIATPPSGPV